MKRLITFFLLLCAALISGCGSVSPKIDHVASAKKLTDGTYRVDLRYTKTISGGPCFNSSFFKSTTYHEYDSLYVKSLEGRVSADEITVKVGGQEVGSWNIEHLRGSVVFANDMMTVQLEQPKYPDGVHIQGYAPYYLNGTYQIVVTNSSPNTASRLERHSVHPDAFREMHKFAARGSVQLAEDATEVNPSRSAMQPAKAEKILDCPQHLSEYSRNTANLIVERLLMAVQ